MVRILYGGISLNEWVINRVLAIAEVYLQTKGTVRSVAHFFAVSKSTVHKDLTERLSEIDYAMFVKVRKLLEYNKSVRHIRGGVSTKLKYQIIKG